MRRPRKRKSLKPPHRERPLNPYFMRKMRRYAINWGRSGFLSYEHLAFSLTLLDMSSVIKIMKSMEQLPGKTTEPDEHRESEPEMQVLRIWEDLDANESTEGSAKLSRLLLAQLKRGQRQLFRSDESRTRKSLRELQELFELSCDDIELVVLLYCISRYEPLQQINHMMQLDTFMRLASLATGLPLMKIRNCLKWKSRLQNSGLLERNTEDKPVSLMSEVQEFLSGITDIPLADRYCKQDSKATFPLSSFNVPQASGDIIRSILARRKPCHILLHGQAGAGKTEFARAIVAALKEPVFFFQHSLTKSDDWSLNCAANIVPASRGILLVDEADTLLNTRYFMFGTGRSPDKGWLNTFMERNPCRIIWISNNMDCIEESTLRRFSYSLKFKPFTRLERESIWKELIKQNPLKEHVNETMVRELAVSHPVNAAGIASALDTLPCLLSRGKADETTVKATLDELLKRHEEATGREPRNALNRLTDQYDITAVNVDVDRESLLTSLRHFTNYRREKKGDGNISLLFCGKPGTGKTEFAKYLAHELSMELLVKRASDLLSMWVGGTEHNIRDAFEEAEKDNALLFLDEADSFFINRAGAFRSWEVSQTNELLTRMENFKGILVCCTNLLGNLDPAVMRRFAWKVEFRPLTPEGRLNVYRRYFPIGGADMSESETRQLLTIPDLTPGDIKAVWQKLRFVSDDQRRHETVIRALDQEIRYRNGAAKPIGFVQ